MPYSKDNPPDRIKSLPEHAQHIWIAAFNAALEQYDDEGKASAVAFAAVKNKFRQDKDGKWIAKADFLVKNQKSRYTLGIVYEPYELDTDEEWTDAAEIEKSCWKFMENLQQIGQVAKAGTILLEQIVDAIANNTEVRIGIDDSVLSLVQKSAVGDMHSDWTDGIGTVVECYVAPVDFQIGEEKIKKGSWLLGVVWSQEQFQKIESGERIGYSMGGRARKLARVSIDE